jgi:hypothetical protein
MSISSVANSQWSSIIAIRSIIESSAHFTSSHVISSIVESVIIEWSIEFVTWIFKDCYSTFGGHLTIWEAVERVSFAIQWWQHSMMSFVFTGILFEIYFYF